MEKNEIREKVFRDENVLNSKAQPPRQGAPLARLNMFAKFFAISLAAAVNLASAAAGAATAAETYIFRYRNA